MEFDFKLNSLAHDEWRAIRTILTFCHTLLLAFYKWLHNGFIKGNDIKKAQSNFVRLLIFFFKIRN